MELTRKLDEHDKGAWIAVMVLSYIIFWPAGLALTAYMIWSGRMGCWNFSGMGRAGRWHNRRNRRESQEGGKYYETSSGNTAFDDYREETLKRLADEQIDFQSFLERLRHAKDKAEFDQFMDDRGSTPKEPPVAEGNEDRPSA